MIVGSLRDQVAGHGENQLGLYGGRGSGKTHLLNATARCAREQSVRMQVYDATELVEFDAEAFDGYDDCALLAIDNLDALAGRPDWEAAFYRVINRCRAGEFRLLYTLSTRPAELDLALDDLRSRLQWGLLLELPRHDESAVRDILTRRARLLGFELAPEVLSYLLNHHARGLDAQMAILHRLDGASLSRQQRITIPLIKQTLAEGPH